MLLFNIQMSLYCLIFKLWNYNRCNLTSTIAKSSAGYGATFCRIIHVQYIVKQNAQCKCIHNTPVGPIVCTLFHNGWKLSCTDYRTSVSATIVQPYVLDVHVYGDMCDGVCTHSLYCKCVIHVHHEHTLTSTCHYAMLT